MLELQSNPALLIIDMQNGHVHDSGTFAQLGMDVSRHQNIIPTIRHLRSVAQAHNMPIVYTANAWNSDYSDSGILLDKMPELKASNGFTRGSWDSAIVDELKPEGTKEEIVLEKTRNSAFFGTGLEEKLRSLGVNQLIVTGVGTNVCVESTVRDALTVGFPTFVVSDATATLSDEEHQASLKSMHWFGEIATVAEVAAALSREKS